jgi:drug/metabolite transporter (DMT)-like permease
MSWIVYSLLAAMFWGMTYSMSGQLVKHFSSPFIMFSASLHVAVFSLLLGIFGKGFSADFQIARRMGTETFYLVASGIIIVIGQTMILTSIRAKNATMAAMIEITYPLFTALFIWLFFREAQVTWGTLLGGLLIIAGAGCIYFFDKAAS